MQWWKKQESSCFSCGECQDALQYGNQVAAIAAQNVKEKKAPTRAEFLSGFYKADKLRPVITLVLILERIHGMALLPCMK